MLLYVSTRYRGLKTNDFWIPKVSLNVRIANFFISTAMRVHLYPDFNNNQFGYCVNFFCKKVTAHPHSPTSQVRLIFIPVEFECKASVSLIYFLVLIYNINEKRCHHDPCSRDVKRELKQTTTATATKTSPNKRLMSKTIAVHLNYKSLYILSDALQNKNVK